MALGRPHPAEAREHDCGRFTGQQFALVDGLRGLALHQARAPLIPILLGILYQLIAHQAAEPRLAFQNLVDFVAFFGELLLLSLDAHLLEASEVAQLGLEDGLGLDLGELEATDQHRFWLLLGPDDADDFVEVQVRDQQPIKDVQARIELLEPVLEAAHHGRLAKLQPLEQQLLQSHHARAPIEPDDVEVDPIIALEVGRREQVRHQRDGIDAAVLRDDDEAGRLFVIRFIAQVLDHRQLLLPHLVRDLLEHLASRYLEWQRLDHDLVLFMDIGRAGLEAAGASVVHLQQFRARRDDLSARRQVRTLDIAHQPAGRELRIFEQLYAGGDNFAQVVRRDVGRHADCNTGAAIEQQVRYPRR